MGFRAVLTVGLGMLFASCAGSNDSGGDGAGGEGTMGGSGAENGRSGSANGGTTAGSAGDDQGGSSGASQGGSSGTGQGDAGGGQDGSAGDGVAAAGGRDAGSGTVTGVVTTEFGAPNANVLVAVGSTITYTDTDGRFEIPDVAPEYDLVVIVPPESYARVVRGVSERSLRMSAPGRGVSRSANLSGVVAGGAGVPIPDDCSARVQYVGSNVWASAMWITDPYVFLNPDASYTVDVLWSGPASVSGFLYALEHRVDGMGRAISYDGFGSMPFDLTDRSTYAAAPASTIALAPVASRTVSGTVTAASGYFPRLFFFVGPFDVGTVYVPEGTYSAVLPTGLEIATSVTLGTERFVDESNTEFASAHYTIDDSVTTLDLSTPAAAVSNLPAEAAAGIDYDTQFSWDGPAESISTLRFTLERWKVDLITDASSATIPDLTEYGVSHAPGSEGTWGVQSTIGPPAVDDLVRAATADVVPPSRSASTQGLYRTFTLAN